MTSPPSPRAPSWHGSACRRLAPVHSTVFGSASRTSSTSPAPSPGAATPPGTTRTRQPWSTPFASSNRLRRVALRRQDGQRSAGLQPAWREPLLRDAAESQDAGPRPRRLVERLRVGGRQRPGRFRAGHGHRRVGAGAGVQLRHLRVAAVTRDRLGGGGHPFVPGFDTVGVLAGSAAMLARAASVLLACEPTEGEPDTVHLLAMPSSWRTRRCGKRQPSRCAACASGSETGCGRRPLPSLPAMACPRGARRFA